MPAMIVADEIERIARGGRQRGTNRSLARIRDRTRRQSGVKISVVGRIELQITFLNRRRRMAKHATIQPRGVYYGGITR